MKDTKNRGLGVIKTGCSINQAVKEAMKDTKNRAWGSCAVATYKSKAMKGTKNRAWGS